MCASAGCSTRGAAEAETKTFRTSGCAHCGSCALWLMSHGITHVAMESTGGYLAPPSLRSSRAVSTCS